MALAKALGPILMVLGLMVMGASLIPFSIMATEGVYLASPNSQMVDYPSSLPMGTSYLIRIDVFEPGTESVVCDIATVTGEEYSKTISLSRKGSFMFTYNWQVPELEEGTVLSFTFRILDSENVTIIQITVYGVIGDFPMGYFTVNDIEVADADMIEVDDPELVIQFYATENGDKIDSVEVQVRKKGESELIEKVILAEVTANTVWENTYTLPEPGTYEFAGWMDVTFTERRFAIVGFLVEWEMPILQLSLVFVGVGLLIVGAVLTVKPRRKR